MAFDTLTSVAKCNDPRRSLLSNVFIIGRRARVAPLASLASNHRWERHLGTRDHKKNWKWVNTNIWTKNWIPHEGTMRPIAAAIPNPPQTVAELIDVSSASRREEVVREVFVPLDADAILKIPLCT